MRSGIKYLKHVPVGCRVKYLGPGPIINNAVRIHAPKGKLFLMSLTSEGETIILNDRDIPHFDFGFRLKDNG